MKYKVKSDYEDNHAGEIGKCYAKDNKRIFLQFDNGDRCGYSPDALIELDKTDGKREKRREDIFTSIEMIRMERSKQCPLDSIIDTLLDIIEHNVSFL